MGDRQRRLREYRQRRHCYHERQDSGGRPVWPCQSERFGDSRRNCWRHFLDQFRPFFEPQWLRLVPALRRMCRTLDRFKTVAANGSWSEQKLRVDQGSLVRLD